MATIEHRPVGATPRAASWMAAAALAALAVAAATLVGLGDGKTGLEAALRLTARLAFLFFWPSYAGGALATLFGDAWRPVKRRARVLGLAFSAVLTVHLGLVAWLCWIGSAPPARVFAIFGVGAFCAYVLLLASLDRIRRMLGDARWRGVQFVGINYILFAFAYDFFGPKPQASLSYFVAYLPFMILTALGPLLRIAAWLKPHLSRPSAEADVGGA